MTSFEPGAERTPADTALRSKQGELLLLVANQARRVPGSVIISSTLIALLVSAELPIHAPLIWLSLVYVSTYFHSRVVTGLPQWQNPNEDQKLTIAAWSFGIHGAILGAPVWAVPQVPVTTAAVLTIFNVGVCSSTLPATAGFRRIFLPYALITLLPIALVWGLTPLLEATWYERLFFVGLTLAYLVSMLGHAKGAYDIFSESYDMRSQRLELTRQLEESLKSSEASSRAKTRFLASASHDLRQPIHTLSLFSGALQKRMSYLGTTGQLDQRCADISLHIESAIKSLTTQLDALLDISRLDAGVVQRSITTVDLHEILQLLGSEFRNELERRNLRFRMDCAPKAWVRTDPALLQRILRNLIGNAIKYTPKGSVRVLVEPGPSGYRVSVIDTGVGIPEAERERVFEEFFQLHNPERDRTQGLGLGLAIVRRLSQLLQIEIELESSLGHGSRFSFTLPSATAGDLPIPAVDAMPERAAPGIEVLVVDDEEGARLGMKTLLEELGYGVSVQASTEAALQLAESHRPSIVLADFQLRGDDNGLKTIRALRQLWPELPALMISASTEPERLQEARDAGVAMLHKPVAAQALRDAIAKAICP